MTCPVPVHFRVPISIAWRLAGFVFLGWALLSLSAAAEVPVATHEAVGAASADWLVTPVQQHAGVYRSEDGSQITLANGLIRRAWRIEPNAACVAFDNLMTGASLLRGVKPEAILTIDGHPYEVGGLMGQPDYAYLTEDWARLLKLDPAAMRLTRWETGKIQERFPWKRVRHRDESLPWPPPGVSLRLD